jgi:hypothetical protein
MDVLIVDKFCPMGRLFGIGLHVRSDC